MDRKTRTLFIACLFVLAVTAIGRAQTMHKDPRGRFAIDIPKGWKLAPQTDEKVFVFKGTGGKSVIIECVPDVNDPAELLKKAEATVVAAGMTIPTLEGEIKEMTLNGLLARWCIYKGEMNGMMFSALCGGVANGENGLLFISLILVTEMPEWKSKLETVFQSIRGSGQKITGVEGSKAVSGGAEAPADESTSARKTYEDPQGRFAVDIPNGWQPAPQTDGNVFVFQGEGKSIIIECVPEVNDPAELFKKAEATVRSAGMTEHRLAGDITEMTLNGLPARWGISKGPLAGVVLAALCGGVASGKNGLFFLSIIPVTDMVPWKDKLERVFQTIRAGGQKITGVEGVKTVTGAVAAAGNSTPWSSALVSLTLPAGWTETPKPRGIEKEVQGMFANTGLPGVSLMAVGYKGRGLSMAKTLDAGIKTFTIAVPNAQPADVQEMEIEGKKINLLVYKGTSVVAGTEVELGAVIVVTKADQCYLNLIAIGPATALAEMKGQVLEIVKTVK